MTIAYSSFLGKRMGLHHGSRACQQQKPAFIVNKQNLSVRQIMRISSQAVSSIKRHLKASVPDSEVFLFGSRSDDSLKGGDIDLLLLTPEKIPLTLLNKVRRLILKDIGEQKIDLINFRKSDDHPFKKVAMESAVRL